MSDQEPKAQMAMGRFARAGTFPGRKVRMLEIVLVEGEAT